jgi:hypothetical protein
VRLLNDFVGDADQRAAHIVGGHQRARAHSKASLVREAVSRAAETSDDAIRRTPFRPHGTGLKGATRLFSNDGSTRQQLVQTALMTGTPLRWCH